MNLLAVVRFFWRFFKAVLRNILFLCGFLWNVRDFAIDRDNVAAKEEEVKDIRRVFRLDPNQQHTKAFTYFHDGLIFASTDLELDKMEKRDRERLQNIALWDSTDQCSQHPFVKFGKAEVLKLGNFFDEWNSYRYTSRSLFLFFKLLQAPYPVLDHVMDLLECQFMKVMTNFRLVIRGSVGRKFALKSGCDLDVDLIIPFSYISKSSIASSCVQDLTLSDVLSDFCEIIYRRIRVLPPPDEYFPNRLYDIIIQRRDDSKFTRSLKLKITIYNYEVEVDLFPKFVDDRGGICSVSKNKQWEPFNWPDGCEVNHLSVEASVLFFKFWKNQCPQNQDFRVQDVIRSFHIGMVISEIQEQKPSCQILIESLFSGKYKLDKVCVINLMEQAIEIFRKIYDPSNFSQYRNKYFIDAALSAEHFKLLLSHLEDLSKLLKAGNQ